MKDVLSKLKAVTDYAKSRHASSVVVGLAMAGYAAGVYFGVSREVLIPAAVSLVLILVPLANEIHE